ncbi:MAG: hypothetical protein U0414_20025 [Polyangiaceae bacterium]
MTFAVQWLSGSTFEKNTRIRSPTSFAAAAGTFARSTLWNTSLTPFSVTWTCGCPVAHAVFGGPTSRRPSSTE